MALTALEEAPRVQYLFNRGTVNRGSAANGRSDLRYEAKTTGSSCLSVLHDYYICERAERCEFLMQDVISRVP